MNKIKEILIKYIGDYMKYFGTDGIRGIVNKDLTIELLQKIGRAISILNIKEIYIGYDTRESNNLVLTSLVSGMLSKGINVINVGLVSTPLLQRFSSLNKVDALMITASHNPYFYNGIKIFLKVRKLTKKEEELIESKLDDNLNLCVGRYTLKDIKEEYINSLKNKIKENKYNITIDTSNGALSEITKDIFNDEKIKIINDDYNGININDNVGSLYIDKVKLDSDYLFSFDGDGDRILFKDNKRIYEGDLIIFILAKYYKIKKVVLTKNVNLGILNLFKKNNIKVFISDIGDKNVLNLMQKEKITLGGESSGHIIDLNLNPYGDALITTINLINILNEIDLNKYLKHLEYYPYINLNLKKDYNLTLLNKINEKYENKKTRINIRISGTEEIIRVNINALDKDKLNMIIKEIKDNE